MATGIRQAPKDKLNLKRVGTSGTDIVSGFLRDEYQADLQDPYSRATTYDKMRRSDSTVATMLRALELPLIRGTYNVEPASQEPIDLEACEFVKHCLFDAMRQPWTRFLTTAVKFAQFGFAAFEVVHKVEEWTYQVEHEDGTSEEQARPGMIKWDRFAWLGPKTIQRWTFDDNDDIASVEQAGWHQDGSRTSYKSSITIDGAFLLVLTMDQLGNNVEGVSLLRPAYKNWLALNTLYKLEMVGLQRMAVGTPVISEPEGATTEDREEASAIVKSYVVHEEAGLVMPTGWDARILEGKMNSDALQGAIIQHKGQILALALVQFLQHGTDGQGGNRALAGSQIDLFTQLLWALGEYVAEAVTAKAHQLLDLNYSNLKRKPKVKLVQLVDQDVAAAVKLINECLTAGSVTMHPALKEHVDSLLDLPERPKEDEQAGSPEALAPEKDVEAQRLANDLWGSGLLKHGEARRVMGREPEPGTDWYLNGRGAQWMFRSEGEPPPEVHTGAHLAPAGEEQTPPQEPPEGQPQQMSERAAESGWKPERPLRAREQRLGLLHFSEQSDALDGHERAFLSDAKKVTDRQRAAVVKSIEAAVEKDDQAALSRIEVPLMGEYRSVLAHHLEAVASEGWRQVGKELGATPDGADGLKAWAQGRAAVLSAKHEADLRAQVVGGVLDALAEQRLQDSTVQELSMAFSDRLLAADFGRILDAAEAALPKVGA